MSPRLEPLEGKYEIEALIREGGMGAIYKARHRLLDEIRVIKVMRQQFEDDAGLHQRFIQEARAAIRLRHPNVIQIFDFLLEGEVGYIVMEYIDGVDLGQLVDRGVRPSLPLFLEVARQALRALGYLHQQGFVHRDISPDNLMLGRDFADKPLVKMIDLGIAKQVDSEMKLTADGMFLGKFRYSSPEHFGSSGATGVEPRSDLYALGVVLVEFLTGRYPIRGDGNSELIAGHLFHPPLGFDDIDPENRVPAVLRDVLLRTLEKDPASRFASARELADALADLQRQFPLNEATLSETHEITSQSPEHQTVERPSTQDRLDRGFVHPTPAPVPPTEVEAPQEPPVVSEEQVTALLGGAEALLRLSQPEQARPQLETILRLDPGNARAEELLREVENAIARTRDKTTGAALPTPAVPEKAQAAGSPPEDKLFDHHLEVACTLADQGNFTDALPHLEAALEQRTGNTTVMAMLDEVRDKLTEERQRSAARLEEEVRQLRDMLAGGELDAVRERIVSARRAYGDAPLLSEVEAELQALLDAQRLRELDELLDEAAAQREAAELTRAHRTLERARALLRKPGLGDTVPLGGSKGGRDSVSPPSSPQGDSVPSGGSKGGHRAQARLDDEEVRLEEAHRLAAELDEALYAIEEHIRQNKLVEADRALYQAREAFGSRRRLVELRERLERIHHQELEREVQDLVAEIERLHTAGELEEALRCLEKARIMAPESPLTADLEEREAVLRRALSLSGKDRLKKVEARVKVLIATQDLEQAEAELKAAEAGTENAAVVAEVFGPLHERIREGYQERVNALIHEAGVASEEQRYDAAVLFLEQALALTPDDEWLADRLEQARVALENPPAAD